MAAETIEVRDARLEDPDEIQTLLEILDAFARSPGGQNAPLSPEARLGLGPGLSADPDSFVLFGCVAGRVVGAAVCYWGFSSFGGRPFVNLHDFAVLPESQGQGVGTALMTELEVRARARGCCKMTLEVHDSNEGAKRLYARAGFEGWESPTWSVTKML